MASCEIARVEEDNPLIVGSKFVIYYRTIGCTALSSNTKIKQMSRYCFIELGSVDMVGKIYEFHVIFKITSKLDSCNDRARHWGKKITNEVFIRS